MQKRISARLRHPISVAAACLTVIFAAFIGLSPPNASMPSAFAQTVTTVSVADFGAVPNDGRDDSAAITAAISAAKPGDVVRFSEGTYTMSSQVNVQSGRILQGTRGKTTIVSPAGAQAFKVGSGNSATINDFKFSGGVLFIDGKSKVVITGNDVTGFDGSGDIGCGRGAIGGTGAQLDSGSYIANNDFHDSPNGRSIYFFTAFDSIVENNSFRNVFLGIKSNNADQVRAKNLTIQRNYFSENRYHSVELQGTIDGFWFLDNYYEKPRLSSVSSENDSTFAFSLIYTAISSNQHILRNYVNAPERPDGTGARLAFEVGEFAEVKDNYVRGCGTVLTVYGPGTTVDGNNFDGARYGNGYVYGPQRQDSMNPPAKSTITVNNNASVKLSWDINRAKPGAGTTSGVSLLESVAITGFTATPGKNSCSLKWNAVAGATYKLEIKTTDGTDAWASLGDKLTDASAIVYQLRGAWKHNYRVTASTGATATLIGIPQLGTVGVDSIDMSQPESPTLNVPASTQPTNPVSDPDVDMIIPKRNGVWGTPTVRPAT